MAKAEATTKPTGKVVKKARIVVPTKKVTVRDPKGTPPPKLKSALKSKSTAAAAPAEASSSKAKITQTASSKTKPESLSSKAKGKKKSTGEEEPTPLPSTFKIIAGSYEKLLYGLNGTTSVNDEGKLEFKIKPIFIFPAHVSCIKAVAASPQGGKWLATGSADEIIKIWDLRRRKEVGGLMHHEGSITHLHFPSRSHLLSASEDGSLCLFRARDWSVLRALKGHKGRVNAVTIHPSGKVGLSVGKDRTLRMWDLMRGKGVASTKLGKEGESVRWSVDGERIAVQSGSTIDIYSTSMELQHTITHPSRLHDVQFCKHVKGDQEILFAGAEDKKLSIYIVPKDASVQPTIFAQMVGHGNRVKAFQMLRIALPEASGRTETTIVSTVSSDGKIRLYDLNDVPEWSSSSKDIVDISPVAEYDSNGTRLTCVTLADADTEDEKPAIGKRKRSNDEGDSDADSENDEDGDDDDGEEDEEEAGFGSGWEDEEEEEVEGEEEEEED